jgi:tetrathionate reductase subunit C
MMRWNVVIGGQEISKTGKGLLDYTTPMLGQEGLLMALAVLIAPLFLLVVLIRFLPPWEHGEAPAPTSAH